MAKAMIPVYDICTIDQQSAQKDLLIDRFGAYLEKHYHHLHHPHRHSFYHLVFFTKGKGTHSIDFEQFRVKPGQVYCMIPGQVHSWYFEGGVDGYIVHFNEALFSDFLQQRNYLEQFNFFRGVAEDGVCQLPASVQKQVITLFEEMLTESGDHNSHYLDMIRLRLLEFFITIDRAFAGNKSQRTPPQK